MDPRVKKGSVVQLNENMGEARAGWIGAFLLVDEVREWGVQGFVHHIETHEENRQVWGRITWDKLDYIGEAVMRPEEESPDE